MNLKQVEVSPQDGDWVVLLIPKDKRQKSVVLDNYRLQKHAAIAARAVAMFAETEFVEKGKDGAIRNKDSFGNDPSGRG